MNANRNIIDIDTENLNHPNCYKNMGLQEKQKLDEWIKSKFEPSKRIYRNRSSYGLKHDFNRDTGIYVTNGEFKGAMLAAGFATENEKELNWHFKIKEKVPDSFYGWCVKRYKHRDSLLGDLARDMKNDSKFPKISTDKKDIEAYLISRHGCYGALKAFEKAWRYYENYKITDGKSI